MSAKTKYEIIEIDNVEVTVDVSLLIKSEELFFNATKMAKPFGKRPNYFWKQPQNLDYLAALITLDEGNKKKEDFVQTKKGNLVDLTFTMTWPYNLQDGSALHSE